MGFFDFININTYRAMLSGNYGIKYQLTGAIACDGSTVLSQSGSIFDFGFLAQNMYKGYMDILNQACEITYALPISSKASTDPDTPAQSNNDIDRTFSNSGEKYSLNWWKAQGYDTEMGKKLSEDANRTLPSAPDPGNCTGYTLRTVNRFYHSKWQRSPKAFQFGEKVLCSKELNGKFKKFEVKPGMTWNEIPDGAICLWKPNTPGFTRGKAATMGHGAIKVTNGKKGTGAYSNYVEKRHMPHEIWIPVK